MLSAILQHLFQRDRSGMPYPLAVGTGYPEGLPTPEDAPPADGALGGMAGNLKESDILRLHADHASNQEALAAAIQKWNDAAKKRDDAMEKVKATYAKIAELAPVQMKDPGQPSKQEAAWGLGLGVLGRLFGGPDAMPGIREGEQAYFGTRQKQLDDAARLAFENARLRDSAVRGSLEAALASGNLDLNTASADVKDARDYAQALQRDQNVYDRQRQAAQDKADLMVKLEGMKDQRSKQFLINEAYNNGTIDAYDRFNLMSGIGPARAAVLEKQAKSLDIKNQFDTATFQDRVDTVRLKAKRVGLLNDLTKASTSVQNALAKVIPDKEARGWAQLYETMRYHDMQDALGWAGVDAKEKAALQKEADGAESLFVQQEAQAQMEADKYAEAAQTGVDPKTGLQTDDEDQKKNWAVQSRLYQEKADAFAAVRRSRRLRGTPFEGAESSGKAPAPK